MLKRSSGCQSFIDRITHFKPNETRNTKNSCCCCCCCSTVRKTNYWFNYEVIELRHLQWLFFSQKIVFHSRGIDWGSMDEIRKYFEFGYLIQWIYSTTRDIYWYLNLSAIMAFGLDSECLFFVCKRWENIRYYTLHKCQSSWIHKSNWKSLR